MRKYSIRLLATLFAIFICQNTFAEIDPGAPSASHRMESAAAAMHEYLHHHYDSSYNTHGLEESATELHHLLHEWTDGMASESEVAMGMNALKQAWIGVMQSINPANVLYVGDTGLDELYLGAKDQYKELRFLLRKAK